MKKRKKKFFASIHMGAGRFTVYIPTISWTPLDMNALVHPDPIYAILRAYGSTR